MKGILLFEKLTRNSNISLPIIIISIKPSWYNQFVDYLIKYYLFIDFLYLYLCKYQISCSVLYPTCYNLSIIVARENSLENQYIILFSRYNYDNNNDNKTNNDNNENNNNDNEHPRREWDIDIFNCLSVLLDRKFLLKKRMNSVHL